MQGISVILNNSPLDVINVYSPPNGPIPDYEAILNHPSSDSIIMGDFNAHSAAWNSAVDEDDRGTALCAAIDASDFAILNSDTHTRSLSGTL